MFLFIESTSFRVLSLCVVLCFGAPSLEAASFDCSKAANKVEKLICSDPALSDLDEKLAEAYRLALKAATDKGSIREQQHIWLIESRDRCEDEFGPEQVGDGAICILVAYEKRLAELTGKNPSTESSYWWMRTGHNDALCQTLYRELRKHRPQDLGACTGSVVLALPGMKESENWKELNPREYKELFKRILQYQAMGARSYFGQWSDDATLRRESQESARRRAITHGISDQALEKRHLEFVNGGGRMRVKTLQLMHHPLGRSDITYDTPQTLLELHYYKPTTLICPKAPSLNIPVQTYYVTTDLSGPDPRIQDGDRGIADSAQLVEHSGTHYLMALYTTGGVSLYRDQGYGYLMQSCSIERRP